MACFPARIHAAQKSALDFRKSNRIRVCDFDQLKCTFYFTFLFDGGIRYYCRLLCRPLHCLLHSCLYLTRAGLVRLTRTVKEYSAMRARCIVRWETGKLNRCGFAAHRTLSRFALGSAAGNRIHDSLIFRTATFRLRPSASSWRRLRRTYGWRPSNPAGRCQPSYPADHYLPRHGHPLSRRPD
jgi:hypothetical protein